MYIYKPCVYIHGRSIDNVYITVSRLWGVTLMFIIQIETHFLLKRIFVSSHSHADRHCHFDFVFPNIGSGYITEKFHEHTAIGIFIIYQSFGTCPVFSTFITSFFKLKGGKHQNKGCQISIFKYGRSCFLALYVIIFDFGVGEPGIFR